MKHANIAFFVPMAGCPHRCSFCDQTPITGGAHAPTPQEVETTLSDAQKRLAGCADATEIAFFGGSFTMIPRPQMEALLAPAYEYVKRGAFSGIRLSTRPDAIDEEVLAVLKNYGVTSIELGAQSSDDRVLEMNRRGHSFAATRRASELIKSAGFSLGLQMMTGLYGATPETDTGTAHDFAALSPDTMRVYPALVLERTELARLWRDGVYTPQTLEEAVSLAARLLDIFDRANIKVIKVGLHAERELEGALLAGPYHPAFRELCDSRRLRVKVDELLSGRPAGKYTLRVPPPQVSKLVGQHRANLEYWAARGWDVHIKPGESIELETGIRSHENAIKENGRLR